MKRLFAMLLSLMMTLSLLTSCEMFVPGPTERPSIGLPSEPAPTETADPTVDEHGIQILGISTQILLFLKNLAHRQISLDKFV